VNLLCSLRFLLFEASLPWRCIHRDFAAWRPAVRSCCAAREML